MRLELRVEGIEEDRDRWEDCTKRDLVGMGGENESEGWGDGDGCWRRL